MAGSGGYSRPASPPIYLGCMSASHPTLSRQIPKVDAAVSRCMRRAIRLKMSSAMPSGIQGDEIERRRRNEHSYTDSRVCHSFGHLPLFR